MKIRKRICMLAAFLLLMTIGFAVLGKTEALAASTQYYQISAQFIDKFDRTKNKLKLKCNKKSILKSSKLKGGTELVNPKLQKSGVLNFKIAPNCKWKYIDVVNEEKKKTVSYKRIKKSAKKERKLYKEFEKQKKEMYKKGEIIEGDTEYETKFSIILVVRGKKIQEVVAYGFMW